MVICFHWHWLRQHVMLLALSMVPLHLLGQDDWNEVQHDFSSTMLCHCHWCWHHMMLSEVKGTTTFITSRQLKWGATWLFRSCDTIVIATGITWCHWCWCHMMSLALVSVLHDAYSIINGTITPLGQDDISEVQHELLSHMMQLALASASCAANSIVNGTSSLPKSRWSKWSATWLFWSCDTIGTNISIT